MGRRDGWKAVGGKEGCWEEVEDVGLCKFVGSFHYFKTFTCGMCFSLCLSSSTPRRLIANALILSCWPCDLGSDGRLYVTDIAHDERRIVCQRRCFKNLSVACLDVYRCCYNHRQDTHVSPVMIDLYHFRGLVSSAALQNWSASSTELFLAKRYEPSPFDED